MQDLGPRLEIQLPQEDSEKRDMICLRSEQAHLDRCGEKRLLPQGQSRESSEEAAALFRQETTVGTKPGCSGV